MRVDPKTVFKLYQNFKIAKKKKHKMIPELSLKQNSELKELQEMKVSAFWWELKTAYEKSQLGTQKVKWALKWSKNQKTDIKGNIEKKVVQWNESTPLQFLNPTKPNVPREYSLYKECRAGGMIVWVNQFTHYHIFLLTSVR